jgi:hypothetical protein
MFNGRRTSTLSTLFTFAVSIFSSTFIFGQVTSPGTPGYVNAAPVDITQIDPLQSPTDFVFQLPADGNIFGSPTLGRSNPNGNSNGNPMPNGNHPSDSSNIDGLTTLATFNGEFSAQAGPSKNHTFRFTMIGNPPEGGGTTTIPANISEVSLQLLNADGSVFKTVLFDPFEQLTLNSPNFQNVSYDSSLTATQYGDAIHRAQFYDRLKPGQPWHTILDPKVVNRVTITVPFFVGIQLQNGGPIYHARSYFTGTAPDGNVFVLMVAPLFNFFFQNEVVHEILRGNFTQDGLNITAFPNTYVFNLNVNNPNVPGPCCILGFHTYFLDGSVPQNRWVTEYFSWTSPGLFLNGVQDVTALSHETAESFGNPFLENTAPNWQFPGQPANSTVCQANLEEGDPIEVLPNATVAITINNFTYHPQDIPLRQWFEMGATSSAIDGAFSYPAENVLPHSAIPCP